MAAEIRLALGLDLAYFRQEMRKAINIVQSEFTGQINVKINRQSLQRESQYLANYFRRKNYRINVNTNLDAEILKAKNLTQKLNKINGRKVPVSIQSAITNADVEQFRRDVQSKLGGIKVKIEAELGQASRSGFAAGPAGAAGLYEYMRSQGLSGGNMPGAGGAVGVGRSERLRKALEDLSVKQLQALAKESGIAGVSRLRKDPLISRLVSDLNQDIAENILGNIKNQMRGEGGKIQRSFLDKIARAVMFMAGVDPEQLRREAARRRLPPAIDFPATVPSRTIPIGPSATGRALTGVTQGALPGRSIANAKYLPSDLGVELKRILRGAAYAFIDSLNERVRQVRVREIGQAQLAPSRVAGLLPSAVGRQAARYGGPGDVRGRRIAEAYARSAARGASVMAEGPQGFALGAGGSGPAGPFRQYAQPPRGGAIVPFQASMAGGGGLTPPSGPGGFRGLSQQLSGLRQAMAPLQQARLPLTGAVAELGGEFGNAIKQVLLFGTAYKALAFILNIPAQAFEAARSLASFKNQLMAITDGGPAFEQSLQFISDTVQRFNVPLESARIGFARLYASMEPAGIDQGTIQGLFTGVSQAAATLSLTPDQVDRVTYAFSQMASKGKIMSEEVTGQLGDVIPGALSLMADAAGMSMAEFKDAMEAGQLTGDAMGQVFNNLAIVLDERFGKGAEGAAKTLQGAITNINNSLQLMYEALSPVVNQFAQAFGPKIQSLIEDVTDVFTVLSGNFADTADAAKALSPRAMAIYQAIEKLRPAVQNAASSIASLGQFFLQLSPAIVSVTTVALQFLNTNLGRGLIVFTGAVGALTAAFGLLKATGLIPTIAALYNFIAAMTAAQAKQFALWIAGLTRNMLGLRNAFRVARVSAVLFTGALTALATAGISLVIAGIANAMLDVGDNARQAAGDVAELKKQLDGIAGAGDVAAAQAVLTTKQGVEQAANLQIAVRRRELEEAKKRRGATAGVGVALAEQNLRDAEAAYGKAVDERTAAERTVRNAERVAGERATAALPPRQEVTLGGGKGEGKGKSAKNKLKEYDRDLSDYYTNIARTESEAIKQRMDLTAREKEIALAVVDFTLKEKLAKAQYQRDIAKVNELIAADRQQYLADKKTQLETELQLAQQEFGTIVLSPFTKRAESEIEAQNELKQSIKALKSGREELTAVEKAEIFIQEVLKGVTEEYKDQLAPFIQRLRDVAKETARLSKEEKGLIEQRKYDKGPLAEAQNKLRIADMLDPRAELRERIRQQLGESATPERIEELAKLEESAQGLEDMKNAVRGVRDEFAGLFSTMITDSALAQESLAQSFANIGKSFADMAGRMIAQWLFMKTIGLAGNLFGGATAPMLKSSSGAAMTAGQATDAGFNMGASLAQGFATGGVVTGPTLGLIGEGRFNEAVVPLPNGKSIPVDLGGGTGGDIATSIVVNVNNGQASSSMKGNQGNQLAKNIEGAVKELIMRETRPGGIIYSSRQ